MRISSEEERSRPDILFTGIQQDNVTIIDFVPSFMKFCTQCLEKMAVNEILNNKLRMILFASEVLPYKVVNEWKKLYKKDIKYVNMYGLSETTGIISTYELPLKIPNEGIAPIGKPLDNINLFLLGEDNEYIGNNTAGQLYMYGPTLCKGYWSKGAINENNFFDYSDRKKGDIKIFKTGDICKYDKKILHYLGRSDHQLKIKGIRIDPVEIEIQLKKFDGIEEAIVVQRSYNDENYIVAFLLIEKGSTFNSNELYNSLYAQLPPSMLPAYYIRIESIPLTLNGKIDRKALPQLDKQIINLQNEYREPMTFITEEGKEVLALIEEIYKLDNISLSSDIKELGSDSLTYLKLIIYFNNKYGINLTLKDVINQNNVKDLIELILKFIGD